MVFFGEEGKLKICSTTFKQDSYLEWCSNVFKLDEDKGVYELISDLKRFFKFLENYKQNENKLRLGGYSIEKSALEVLKSKKRELLNNESLCSKFFDLGFFYELLEKKDLSKRYYKQAHRIERKSLKEKHEREALQLAKEYYDKHLKDLNDYGDFVKYVRKALEIPFTTTEVVWFDNAGSLNKLIKNSETDEEKRGYQIKRRYLKLACEYFDELNYRFKPVGVMN